jgi:hypothetical protein
MVLIPLGQYGEPPLPVFFFLRLYSVSTTLYIAIVTNTRIGLTSLFLQEKAAAVLAPVALSSKTGDAPIRSATREESPLGRVDNDARGIYGQLYVTGYEHHTGRNELVNDIMMSIQSVYRQEAARAVSQKSAFPSAVPTMQKIQGVITSIVKAYNGS